MDSGGRFDLHPGSAEDTPTRTPRERVEPVAARGHYLFDPMGKVDHEEIIALSEDPNVSFDEVPGRPPTSEERRRMTEPADTLFRQASPETRVEVIRALPAHI